MLSKLRAKHPYVYAVLVYVIFTVAMNGTAALIMCCPGNLFEGAVGEQLSQIISELVPAAIFCLMLWRTGKLALLTKRGQGFRAGLAIGGYSLGFILFFFAQSLVGYSSEGDPVNFAVASVFYIVAMLMVGMTEEIEARALIGETFLEHYGTTREGAIRAALASGVIFGVMHLTNAFSGDLSGTLVQVALCVTGGVLYGAVYFRSGNIWAIALIHGLNDVAAGTGDWLFNGGVSSVAAGGDTGFSLASLIFPVVMGTLDLVVAFYLLRPEKADQVAESWPELEN